MGIFFRRSKAAPLHFSQPVGGVTEAMEQAHQQVMQSLLPNQVFEPFSPVPSDLISPNGFLRLKVFNSKPRPNNSTNRANHHYQAHPVAFYPYKLGQSCGNKAGLPNNLIDLRGNFPAVNPDKARSSHSSCTL